MAYTIAMGIRTQSSIKLVKTQPKATPVVSRSDAVETVPFMELFPISLRKAPRGTSGYPNHFCEEFSRPVEQLDRCIHNLAKLNPVRHADYPRGGTGDYFDDLLDIPNSNMKIGMHFERLSPPDLPSGDYSIWFSMVGPEQPIDRLRSHENLGRLYRDNGSGKPRLIGFYENINPFMYRILAEFFRRQGRMRFNPDSEV
jgi:hypothetical protein